MTNKYGNFSEPGYISIGDPFKKKNVDERSQGLNFKATMQKTGVNNDGMFNKFLPQYVGEKYGKTGQERAAEADARRKQHSSDNPFRPAKPMQLSSGLGDNYGTMGPKRANMGTGAPVKPQKGDFGEVPRNIVTNPSKKGTYGMNKTTLGEKIGVAGATGEYTYAPSDYDAPRKAELARKVEADKMIEGRNPFRPTNPPKAGGAGVPGRTMNGKGPGVCGEFAYKENGPTKKVKPEEFEKPFRPSNPAKGGYNSTINKFPAYTEDPLDAKLKAAKEERMAEHKLLNDMNAFRPTGIPRTKPTPSVVAKNMPKS